jgi:tRNA threonylcarbamoyladenosine biosynthesis protein TsaB
MDCVKRIVAIETSGRHGSVATLRGDIGGAKVIAQTVLSSSERTAQSLAPTLQKLLAETGWPPKSVELVAVTVGPGSFTGLRIGVTTAKTFAYAVSAEVVGVNTLVALAHQAPPMDRPLWTILDAQRQELFAARFIADRDGHLQTDRETTIIAQDKWLAELRAGDYVTGTALSRIAHRLPEGVAPVPDSLWQPMAESVGCVAWQAYQSGRRDDLWKLTPHYYRASSAEEKLAPT